MKQSNKKAIYRTIYSICEVFFPENDEGVPDFRQTNSTVEMLNYIARLPVKQRAMFKILYFTFDYFPILLFFSYKRFHKQSLENRDAFIRSMEKSRIFQVKLLADGLKANQKMIYFNHPLVLKYIGEFRLRRYDGDELDVDVKAKAYENRHTTKKPKTETARSAKKKTTKKVAKKASPKKTVKPTAKTPSKKTITKKSKT